MVLPVASLITRTYGNRETYLRRAAECVFSQTAGPIEWIVAEDGKGSAAETIGALLPPDHVVIRHLALPKGGRSRAANAGLDAAKGEFIGFYDDDDELFPDHVKILSELLYEHPLSGAAYAASIEAKRYIDRASSPSDEKVFLRPSASSMVLLETNPFPIQAVLFRRSIRFHQRFDHNLDALEDWLFWIELLLERKLVWTPEITSRFYILGDESGELARIQPHIDAEPHFKIQADGLLAERGLWDYGKVVRHAQGRLDSAMRLARLSRLGQS